MKSKSTDLRRRAEARSNQIHPPEGTSPHEGDILRLVHELQVHQIELEMQNEELQQSRAEVEEGLERYTELYEFSPVGYFTLTRDGTIRQANLFGARLLQVDRTALMGMRLEKFVREVKRPVFKVFLDQVFSSQNKETCELELVHKGAAPCWIQIEAVSSTKAQECRAAVLDITVRKQAELELQNVSMHDALTGLYNHAYFYETMQRLERGRHYPISLLMADVDHLKLTNDRFGHAAGDALLVRAAQIFGMAFRAEDIVARIGGDEFAVLLPDTNAVTAAVVLERFKHLLQEHNTTYPDQPLQFSFGHFTAENNISLDQSLKEADADLYRAKRKRVIPNYPEKTEHTLTVSELRRQAEELHSQNYPQPRTIQAEADMVRLVHELEVHQIELDLQNEELQHSRTELEAALESYADLYDFAPVGYFSLKQDGMIDQVNLNGARLLGVERLHLVGVRFGLFVREDFRSGFADFLEEICKSQSKGTCEFALLKEGSEPLWVQMEGIATGDGQRCRAVVVDINARKRAEEQLQKAQAELERLLEVSNDGRQTLLHVVAEKKQAEEQIRQLNADLEQRVRERTLALRAAVEQLQQSEATIQTLFRISKKLNTTLNVDTILDELAQEAIRIVNGESGFAGLCTPAGMTVRKYFRQGAAIPFEHTWPAGKGIPGWVLKNKVPYGTSDATHDPILQHKLAINAGVRSIICTPILDSAGEVLGFFDIRDKQDGNGFTIHDQEMLMALAPAASIAIQNALAYQQRLTAEDDLRESTERLRALAANLEAVREEERTRIARELHDQLGQALSAMKFDLAWLSNHLGQQNAALAEKAKAITAQMDAMIKTVRRIATELRPAMLDDLGLAASIEWQAGDFEKRTGIVCDVRVPADDVSLPRDQSVALFRIFQEALTNVARHAGAQHIEVILAAGPEALTLQVHDDGRGIEAHEIAGQRSLGLLGMRERAERLGGTFAIQGRPGDGTLVTVSFPLTKSK